MTRRENPWVRTRIVILRPGVPGRGYYRPELRRPGVPGRRHYRTKRPRLGVPNGDITGPNGRTLVFLDGDIAGQNGRGLVFTEGDITGPSGQAWCSRTGTLQAQIPSTASDGLAPSAFDLSLEYTTDNVVLFRQPPSSFSQWSASSFVVDGVSYSCAEQFIMAEKARRFKDHRAVKLIMSSPDPSTHKRIGRGVHNFNFAA